MGILLTSLLFSIQSRSLWLVLTISSLHPINICTLLRLQLIAKHSPMVTAYRLSTSVVNQELVNTKRYPSGQHVKALVGEQAQCCCNSKRSIPTLLESVWRHVRLLISNVFIPFCTLLIKRDFESLNNFSSVAFQQKNFFVFTKSRNNYIIELMKYA